MKSDVHIIPTFWKAGQSLLVFCIVTDPRHYVEATYTWVCNNYDGTKPLHKLTLVYAMIFSKCLPNICNNTKPLNVSSTQDSISLVHQCPWVTHKDPNCKGKKNPISFVVMMTTFIISIYEDQSPL